MDFNDKNKPKQTWDHKKEITKEIGPGTILLAEPFMLDPHFKRSVVLLCEHNEEGSIGFILTTFQELDLSEMIKDFPPFKTKVFFGGPVENDTLHYLHTFSDIPESTEISNGLYWGGNFESIKALAQANELSEKNIKFFLGYSGWSPSQLMDEIKTNSWIISKANKTRVLNTDPKELWTETLISMKGVYKIMSGYPENPIYN